MYKFKNKTYNFTELAVQDLLSRYDEFIASCNEEELPIELAMTLFELKGFEKQFIKGLHERFIKVYPYDYNSKMADCLDISDRQIRRFCNKS